MSAWHQSDPEFAGIDLTVHKCLLLQVRVYGQQVELVK